MVTEQGERVRQSDKKKNEHPLLTLVKNDFGNEYQSIQFRKMFYIGLVQIKQFKRNNSNVRGHFLKTH
jgi:hypothetical protein